MKKNYLLSFVALIMSVPLWGQTAVEPQLPPLYETFDDPDSYGSFSVIDSNNDGVTFEIVDGDAKVRFSQELPTDDWLVLPPLRLEAGKGYTFSCDAYCQWEHYRERFEVKVATEATASALENGEVLVKPTVISCTVDNPYKAEALFVPETDGVYYIGIHGCSDPDVFFLHIDNVSLTVGISSLAPAQVTEAIVESDPTGALGAKLTFKAPSLNFAGDELEELAGVKIARDGQQIADLPAKPGQSLDYDDKGMTAGNHTYTLTPYNSYGDGEPVKLKVFVGFNIPVPSAKITAEKGAHAGQALVSWSPVEEDVAGLKYPEGAVTYKVMRVCGNRQEVLAEGLTTTGYTDDFCLAEDAQQAVYYTVVPVSTAGEGLPTNTPYICLGASYQLPFAESFAEGELQNGVWVTDGLCDIRIYSDYSMSMFKSQDGDNGYVYMANRDVSKPMSLISGVVSLADVPDAVMTFYTLSFRSDNDTKLEVLVDCCDGTSLGEAAVFDDNSTNDGSFRWTERKVNLGAWAGKDIRLVFRITNLSCNYFMIDNIVLKGLWQHNLAVGELSLPFKFTAGVKYDIPVSVANIGSADAENYTAVLFRNGIEVNSVDGPKLKTGETAEIKFTEEPSSTWGKTAMYKVEVVYDKEEEASDNFTSECPVVIRKSDLPVPGSVNGEVKEGGLALSWAEVIIPDETPDRVNDGLADLTPFSCDMPGSVLSADDNIGGWSMIDGDGLASIGVEGKTFPNSRLPMAFIVFNDQVLDEPWEMFADHNGDGNLFISFAAVNGRNDDWLVSPRLNGQAQQISFHVKAILSDMPERYEVYYSTTGKDMADFKIIGSTRDVNSEWTRVTADLPEGARYFAVRYVSLDRYALLLDDFSYIPAAVGDGLELLGYNLYLDGGRINEDLLTTPSMSIALPDDGSEIKATAVYNTGESAPSSSFIYKMTGVEFVADDAVSVTAVVGGVVVNSPMGSHISITDIAGRAYYGAESTGRDMVRLGSGVYIVSVGRHVAKIAVR